MTLKIKADKIIDLPKFGFVERICDFKKEIKCGQLYVSKMQHDLGRISREKYDGTTYTGFAYENEFRQVIRPYIKDLIKADMVEVGE